MKITKNFTLEELYKSATANRYKIDNTPKQEYKDNLYSLVLDVLQPIRDEWKAPIIVSSGYRCEKLNIKVGGAKNSDHTKGCAVDIHTVEDTVEKNKDLFNLILQMAKEGKIKCRQIIDEYHYNWVHLSINNKYNSWKENQVLHITK